MIYNAPATLMSRYKRWYKRYVCILSIFVEAYTSYHWATYERGYNRNFFLSFSFPKERSIDRFPCHQCVLIHTSVRFEHNKYDNIHNDISTLIHFLSEEFLLRIPKWDPKICPLGAWWERVYTLIHDFHRPMTHERGETSRLKVNEATYLSTKVFHRWRTDRAMDGGIGHTCAWQ